MSAPTAPSAGPASPAAPFGSPQALVFRSADWALMRQLGVGRDVHPVRLRLAIGLARHSGWLVAAAMVHAALVHGLGTAMLGSLLLAGLVQLGCKRLARHLNAPRPFALGLCPNHLGHSARGGMPSTHATVLAFLAACTLPLAPMAPALWCLPPVALLTGWARVQAGAHFPSDVLLGLALGYGLGLLVPVSTLL